MQRRFALLARAPHLSRAEMDRYWQDNHGPLVAGVPDYWRYSGGYVQNHLLNVKTDRVPDPAYDGVLESWLRPDCPDPRGYAAHPDYARLLAPDEQRFLDRAKTVTMKVESHVIRKGERKGLKLLSFIPKRPDISMADFARYWREVHAPLVLDTPEVAGAFTAYTQHIPVEGTEMTLTGAPSPHGFAGVLELWFPSLEVFEGCFTSKGYLTRVQPDEAHFIAKGSCRFLLREVQFKGPEG